MQVVLWAGGALFSAVASWVVGEILTALKKRWKR
jgi:hypothetical protein